MTGLTLKNENLYLKPIISKTATPSIDPIQTPLGQGTVTLSSADIVDGDPNQPLPPLSPETVSSTQFPAISLSEQATAAPTLGPSRTPLESIVLNTVTSTLDPTRTPSEQTIATPTIDPTFVRVSLLSPHAVPSGGTILESSSFLSTLLPTEIRSDLPIADRKSVV